MIYPTNHQRNKGKSNIRFMPYTEYPFSSYAIDFTKEVSVKIEKREAGCKVMFNNISVLEESDALLNDNYDWSAKSPMLPGIGTFKCGATITNPSIELVK